MITNVLKEDAMEKEYKGVIVIEWRSGCRQELIDAVRIDNLEEMRLFIGGEVEKLLDDFNGNIIISKGEKDGNDVVLYMSNDTDAGSSDFQEM